MSCLVAHAGENEDGVTTDLEILDRNELGLDVASDWIPFVSFVTPAVLVDSKGHTVGDGYQFVFANVSLDRFNHFVA